MPTAYFRVRFWLLLENSLTDSNDCHLFTQAIFAVVVANDTTKVTVTSPLVTKDNAAVAQVSKRYLRYLTKKYVAKEGLREYLRVLTSGPDAYKITFFDLGEDEEEE